MEYNPSAFLRASPDSTNPNSNPPTADLIILNQPLQDFPTFKTIWSHTHHHICADGGANRLYSMLSNAPEDQRAQFVRQASLLRSSAVRPYFQTTT
jgi:thiamine pyrophosphokinase